MIVLLIHWISGAAFIGGMACYLWVYQAVPFPDPPGGNRPEKQGEWLQWKRKLETRFRSYRWICLLLLLGTGILNLVNGGVAAKISSSFGGWLLIKLFLVVVLFSLTGVYDFLFREKKEGGGKTRHRPTPIDSPLRDAVGYGVLAAAVGVVIVAGFM